MASLVFKMALFGFLGLGIETAFTAALEDKPNRHLFGYSSLWYLPLYWMAPVMLARLYPALAPHSFLIRGAVYTVLIFAFEYAGMWVLRKLLGSSPSEASYRRARWNVHALIRLDFAPAWFVAALAFEYVYRRLP